MNNKIKNTIKFFLFFCVSVVLFWLVYRDQNFENVMQVLEDDVNYFWVILAAVFGLLSHISRAKRWQIVMKSLDYNVGFGNSFMGVMLGYFMNLFIPRMGELTRCGIVNKYEKVPFSKLLGTVIVERVVDVIMLLILIFIVVVTQFKQFFGFFEKNKAVGNNVSGLFTFKFVMYLMLAIGICIFIVWLLMKTKLKDKLLSFLVGLKDGFMAVVRMKQKWSFIAHTIFIWLMYYLMLYICFFAFDFSSHLGPLVALTVFVLGSFGMVAPVQGGIGAWHFMVIKSMLLYIPNTPAMESNAKIFALLTHGSMTALYVVVGVICLIILPIYNSNYIKTK